MQHSPPSRFVSRHVPELLHESAAFARLPWPIVPLAKKAQAASAETARSELVMRMSFPVGSSRKEHILPPAARLGIGDTTKPYGNRLSLRRKLECRRAIWQASFWPREQPSGAKRRYCSPLLPPSNFGAQRSRAIRPWRRVFAAKLPCRSQPVIFDRRRPFQAGAASEIQRDKRRRHKRLRILRTSPALDPRAATRPGGALARRRRNERRLCLLFPRRQADRQLSQLLWSPKLH